MGAGPGKHEVSSTRACREAMGCAQAAGRGLSQERSPQVGSLRDENCLGRNWWKRG